MSKIIPLHPNTEYIQTIEETKRMLKDLEENLFIQAVNLCNCSCWKDWDEKMEDGETYEFDTNQLKDSGDKNAILLVEVMSMLNQAGKELE